MLSNIHCRLNHQFRDNQKASMSLILGALGKLYNFGTKFELFSVIYFWFFAWIIFVWKNEEFWKIYFLTKFVPESIKMNLHTSSAPFWNGISVSNLLILSNLLFFGLYWLSCAEHLCSFFGSDSIFLSLKKECMLRCIYLQSVAKNKIERFQSLCLKLGNHFGSK